MVAPAQVCEIAFLFMELCSAPINLFLQPLLAPLSGDTPTWYTSSPPSFSSLPWVHSDPSYGSVMKSFKKLGPVSTSWFHHCWPVFNCNTWHFLQAFTLVSSASFKFILLSQISSDCLWIFWGKIVNWLSTTYPLWSLLSVILLSWETIFPQNQIDFEKMNVHLPLNKLQKTGKSEHNTF